MRVCIPRFLQIGKGGMDSVPELLAAIGGLKKPLIVTDKNMIALGYVDRLTSILQAGGISFEIFDEVVPDPTDTVIFSGINVLVSAKCDCVIGIGGGSPLDTAKAIAVMSQGSTDLENYRPPAISNAPGLPILAIPTTAGTGSEVTHHTVIIRSSTQEKISCRGEAFMPTAAVIDYELTLSMPKRLSIDNAIDTMTHGIEAYVSKKASLFSDRMALDCLRLVGPNLPRIYKDPEDEKARELLMFAATLGGLAFTNASICLVHAMSRPLGALFHIPHGLSNAMLLPQVTEFSVQSAPDRYADCAKAMGIASTLDPNSVACKKLVQALYVYQENFEVPSLSAYGLEREIFEKSMGAMIDDAIRSGAPKNNPKEPSQEEMREIYEKAW